MEETSTHARPYMHAVQPAFVVGRAMTVRSARPGLVAIVAAPVLSLFAASAAPAAPLPAAAVAQTRPDPEVTLVASRRHRKEATPTAPAAPAKPALVGTFGDWGVYVSQGAKSKVCYALGQPTGRAPSSVKKDGAYVFITNRPGEGVHNEVSIMAGLGLKEGAAGAKAEIGSTGFELVAKGQNAFVKNAAEEGQFVGSLKRRGAKLVIKLPTARSSITDTYSLSGIQQALDRVAKECP